MDAKTFFTNKSFCVLPWTGFELEPNGDVKNCIISKEVLGNINNTDIQDIMSNAQNLKLKKDMNADSKPYNCSGCHLQELHRKDPSSISSRRYYNRELGKNYLNISKEFSLHHVDLRWTNHCNQACVYCSPLYSSKWATELNEKVRSKKSARDKLKEYVFDNVKQLRNVYLAGGEPMLMNENKEFLKLLLKQNPDVTIRVNTNLSSTNTGVFELLCQFKNVHWTVSVESIEKEYEYIRHHGSWKDFLQNLKYIQKLNHKISFNMLYFILNYKSIFNTVDYFKDLGFVDNSFIIGPLYKPSHLNILNLPENMLDEIKERLEAEIPKSMGYLKNSYENILTYIKETTFENNITKFLLQTYERDMRRGVNATKIFPKLFEELDAYPLDKFN